MPRVGLSGMHLVQLLAALGATSSKHAACRSQWDAPSPANMPRVDLSGMHLVQLTCRV